MGARVSMTASMIPSTVVARPASTSPPATAFTKVGKPTMSSAVAPVATMAETALRMNLPVLTSVAGWSAVRASAEAPRMSSHVPAPSTVTRRKTGRPQPSGQATRTSASRIPESTAISHAYCAHRPQPDNTPDNTAWYV